ncbi:MAG: GNAT family N-acetyltransferase [Alphaproteobacteria bacterium]
MNRVRIAKGTTIDQIRHVFGGTIPEWHPDEFIQSRLRSGYVFVALDENDHPIGFLIYSIWWGNCPFIELIKVVEDMRGMGIGSQLLDVAKAEIKAKGFEMLIASSEMTNMLGQKFHEKLGFKKLNSLVLPHGEEQFFGINL